MTASPRNAWTLTANAFNLTPAVIAAERSTADLVLDLVTEGVARTVEIEPGQLWRSFPAPTGDEVDGFRTSLEGAGGAVSIVGVSIDDWADASTRRSTAERIAFILPQLRAAARVGAAGVRVPLGQAGPEVLTALLPVLRELDLVLFEEAQGHLTPDAVPGPYEQIATLDDPHVRLLLDISMLMPALPVTYLRALRDAGIDAAFVERVGREWSDPETQNAVLALLQSGTVPPHAHTLVMNMVIRFGRTPARALRDVAHLIGAVHLKFWDLEDEDRRVSGPIAAIGDELERAAFAGTLCSEWGGHEWLDGDGLTMTRDHLALAARTLGID